MAATRLRARHYPRSGEAGLEAPSENPVILKPRFDGPSEKASDSGTAR
jgi:hypothetical protein